MNYYMPVSSIVFNCEKRIVEFVADKRTTENTHYVQFVWPLS